MNHHFYDVNRRKLIALKDGMIIGRAEGELRFAEDRLMSGRHCKIHIFDNDVLIEDLKSSNRTMINGHVIEPSVRIQLKPGDVLDVGNQRFAYNDRAEVPDAFRPKAQAPVEAKVEEASPFVDYLVALLQFWKWDASTKATWLFISITICFAIWAYFPDFKNPALHGPRLLLATTIVVCFVTASVFFVAQHLFALKPGRTPGKKAVAMMVAVVGNAIVCFALQSALGVPRKLDQNKLYTDCREIQHVEAYEWCKTWIQQNKNNAFFELDAEMQAQALNGLKVWTEKARTQKEQPPDPEATPTPEPETATETDAVTEPETAPAPVPASAEADAPEPSEPATE